MPQYDTYGGPVHIIDGCDADVEFCEETLYGEPFVGIDFEWNRERQGERNPLELVQIATPTDGVFIFRCLGGEPLHPVAASILGDWASCFFGLANLSRSQNVLKVCSGYDNGDCARLWETYHMEIPRNSLLDIHDEAKDRGLQRYGLQGACEDCGYYIYKPKNPNFFYWSRDFLKKSQIRYAAADAWFPLLIAANWELIDLDVDEMEQYISQFWVNSQPGERLHPVARDALLCPNAIKAVCGYDGRDKKKLLESFNIEIPPETLVDVSKVAKRRGMTKTGLKAICRELGYDIFKPHYAGFHKYSGRLRKSQIRYAAADAWFPLLIAAEWGLMDIDEDVQEEMLDLVGPYASV
ncbi:hypothetical protein FOL47_003151 [Perkinsus chesapeaki]|uniref:3'-5' exonuclease domain-containing protein n=1 Tax=Perkinsus chesapeaki TaxID=330153 RepID=A0A7J6M9H0_PERCH|nr:hypothetical protein FOL47_003151 [Perkinsus chesapeaki]